MPVCTTAPNLPLFASSEITSASPSATVIAVWMMTASQMVAKKIQYATVFWSKHEER